MPKKQFHKYFEKDDYFIYDKKQMNCKSLSINRYWFVSFPPVLNLPNKAFNQNLYKKEDAIQFRNRILRSYINQGENNQYKDIIRKYI